MKSIIIRNVHTDQVRPRIAWHTIRSHSSHFLALSLVAGLPALVMATLSVVLVNTADANILGATVLASSFILMGIAIESTRPSVSLLAFISGLLSGILAWLGYHVAPEFAVMGSWILAAWTVPATLPFARRTALRIAPRIAA